jgi:serine/threonine protein phosphatase PrpC
MGNVLGNPVTSIFVERHVNETFSSSYSCVNGYRLSNEDSHSMIQYKELYFNGVFDGHGGDKCSRYVSEHLPIEIFRQEKINLDTIKRACLEVNEKFLESEDTNDDCSGSTATFSIIKKKNNGKYNVIVGNIGDSFTLILKKEEIYCPKFVTIEHKPDLEGEKIRIENNGGFVQNGRVDGILAVSRAFGDCNLKGKVISDPDLHEFDCEEGDIIIHICDGITESNFSIEEVRSYIRNNLMNYQDIAVTSSYTCLEALSRGSNDNLSCMIIVLGNGIDYKNNYSGTEFIPGPVYLQNNSFCNAYKNMASSFDLNIAKVVEKRIKLIQEPDNMSEFEKILYCHPIYSNPNNVLSRENELKNLSSFFVKK